MVEAHREAGVRLPPVRHATADLAKATRGRALVLAPESALGSSWTRRFGDCQTASASGWMRVRGVRRRQNRDRGFVLSDHVDWPGLLRVVRDCGCEEVGLTHGFVESAARWFAERGLRAQIWRTRFVGEEAPEAEPVDGEGPG